MMKDKTPDARSLGPFLCAALARFSVLLYPAQLRFLLGPGLRLDPLLGPTLADPRHSIRPTDPVQTLLLVPPLLQPSPLGPRRSGPLCPPTAVTFLCRGLGRCRR